MSADVNEVQVNIIRGKRATMVSAYVYLNNKLYLAEAEAIRHPDDRQNDEIGDGLAVGRAIRQLGRNILRDAQNNVRREEKRREAEKAAIEARRAESERLSRRMDSVYTSGLLWAEREKYLDELVRLESFSKLDWYRY